MESSYSSVSTACLKCGGTQSLDVSHDPNCEKCKGTGYVNEYYGGGSEVVGTRVDRVKCRSGQILNVECGRCGTRFQAELSFGDD